MYTIQDVLTRRGFLQLAMVAAGQRAGRPRGSEFVFARLRYESGDWDYNPKVAANVLDSIVQYTSIPVYKEEVVIAAASNELLSFPFVFMTGYGQFGIAEPWRGRPSIAKPFRPSQLATFLREALATASG